MTEKQVKSIEAIVSTVADLLQSVDDEDEQIILAERLIFTVINWGTNNVWEAVGLLEKMKIDYLNVYYKCMEEENEEEGED